VDDGTNGDAQTPRVSLVLPTFNRADALRDTLPFTLAVEGVDEIVIVDDASSDGTPELLSAIEDPRVRVVRHERRLGQAAVRNRGVAETSGDWVVFGEDDCRLPSDYVRSMLHDAAAHRADLVGAPWILAPDRPVEQAVAEARSNPVETIVLDQVSRFPARVMVTPFIPAPALVHRRVFARVSFDVGYRGNAFREESAFFVEAVRAGFVCILTPSTYSYQTARWPGGAWRTARWIYELWSMRNNARFLRRNGRWLYEQGLMARPVAAQLRFVAWRLRYLAGLYARRAGGWTLRKLGLK
jgi:glycosyltransferase involved in cell wall biosynthesis